MILTIILIALLIGIKNPVFFTASNLAGIIRNLIIDGMMAYAIMLGIIIGGIDVSFPAIAVCSMYITNRFAQSVDYSGPVILLDVYKRQTACYRPAERHWHSQKVESLFFLMQGFRELHE